MYKYTALRCKFYILIKVFIIAYNFLLFPHNNPLLSDKNNEGVAEAAPFS